MINLIYSAYADKPSDYSYDPYFKQEGIRPQITNKERKNRNKKNRLQKKSKRNNQKK